MVPFHCLRASRVCQRYTPRCTLSNHHAEGRRGTQGGSFSFPGGSFQVVGVRDSSSHHCSHPQPRLSCLSLSSEIPPSGQSHHATLLCGSALLPLKYQSTGPHKKLRWFSCSSKLQNSNKSYDATPLPHLAVVPPKLINSEGLQAYVERHTREPEILRELREETSKLRGSQMLVTVEQGSFLSFLVRLINAQKCIEVGVFTGYSALCTSLSLPDSGRLLAIDRDPTTMALAQGYFARAGVEHKIEARLGDAMEILRELVELPHERESCDFAFLDADKRRYSDYYELLLQLVRPGGLIVVDNVLWKGKVALLNDEDKRTLAMKEFNEFLTQDQRIDFSLVTLGDGMALCLKR